MPAIGGNLLRRPHFSTLVDDAPVLRYSGFNATDSVVQSDFLALCGCWFC